MSKNVGHIIRRVALWLLISIVALILIPLILLYLPPVQNFIKDYAVDKVNSSQTDVRISLERFRLSFPINVDIAGLAVVNTHTGDTMIGARHAGISVEFLPVFTGKVSVGKAEFDNVIYRQGTPDSAMCLTARIATFSASDISTPFSLSRIEIPKVLLDGADVEILLKDTVTPATPDTARNQMVILARDIELRNITYRMAMAGSIDSLGATLPLTHIRDVNVDLGSRDVTVGLLDARSLQAAYLTPSSPAPAGDTAARLRAKAEADSLDAIYSPRPWTIRADSMHIDGGATYAMAGARPSAGLDMNYISVSDLSIDVDSFYNRAAAITVPLRLKATERCGLHIDLSTVFSMDSATMRVQKLDLATGNSSLRADAVMGLGDIAADPGLPIELKAIGYVGMRDIAMAMPSLARNLRDLPADSRLNLKADINGTSGSLAVKTIDITMPGTVHLAAKGQVSSPLDFKRMDGRLNIDGSVTEGLFVGGLMKKYAPGTRIPSSRIKGTVDYTPGLVDGDLSLTTGSGELAATGKWLRRVDGYSARLIADRFPVSDFLPSLGIGEVTMTASAEGRGFDFSSPATVMQADVTIESIGYKGASLHNVNLDARLDTCTLMAILSSRNPAADLDIDITGRILGRSYLWKVNGDVHHVDFEALHLTDSVMSGTAAFATAGRFNTLNGDIDATLNLDRLNMLLGPDRITAPSLDAALSSSDSLTTASLSTGDMHASLHALCSLDSVIQKSLSAMDTIAYQIREHRIDIRPVQRTLPHFGLNITAGADNAVARYLAQTSDISFTNASIIMANDSLLTLHSRVDGLKSGDTRIDMITFDANQHGRFLIYNAKMDNRPGTFDDFAHVTLAGYLAQDRMAAMLRQSDINDRQGFHLGLTSLVNDSTINLKFVPYNPTIAYKQWTVNEDNFILYDYRHHHLDANVSLRSDSSAVEILTEHTAADGTMVSDSTDTEQRGQEDVIVRLKNIRLSEWLSISPFAPPVKGVVDADMRFRWDRQGITGHGLVNLENLYYGRDRVGSFGLDLNVTNDTHSGALHADVALMVDSVKVITATGALNDSTARNPFLLDFDMIHFPLRVANPFLPKNVAQLSGMLNGRMDITGSIAEPIFNGYLDFDSTAVKLGFTGASYRFSEEKIPVDSNVVRFNDFTIAGMNGNPLRINGTVDARHLSDIRPDLSLTARDMQIVNSSRPRGANLYGKAFIDLDARVRGNMSLLIADATVNILPGTNVTYVMQDAEAALTSRGKNEMVRFVQFADTTAVTQADSLAPQPMALVLNANLIISEGSTINVDLSSNGKNKVSVQSNANLTYTQTPASDGRLTGRLNIDKGFVRYTPPFMSEKNFSFSEGSYISFTGNMMNPNLNVRAVERLKANVTQEGQNSRLVNFDIILSLTNTLQNLDVKFDLSTNDDLTIQNELSSMSPEQRANQAMNLLLYNVYTGPGTKGNANLSGNPLFSFLESQINTWAANNIRGVDISFGIDQYDTNTDGAKGTTTSYSYRVSKTLFNDRFKIVVGGNYSTDADADENFSQNLINDISFEYMLNRSGSMYVRLFRHVGYESILEGEITQTGVGFVLKRKLNTLRDIFNFKSGTAVKPKEDETR